MFLSLLVVDRCRLNSLTNSVSEFRTRAWDVEPRAFRFESELKSRICLFPTGTSTRLSFLRVCKHAFVARAENFLLSMKSLPEVACISDGRLLEDSVILVRERDFGWSRLMMLKRMTIGVGICGQSA